MRPQFQVPGLVRNASLALWATRVPPTALMGLTFLSAHQAHFPITLDPKNPLLWEVMPAAFHLRTVSSNSVPESWWAGGCCPPTPSVSRWDWAPLGTPAQGDLSLCAFNWLTSATLYHCSLSLHPTPPLQLWARAHRQASVKALDPHPAVQQNHLRSISNTKA